MNPDRKTLADLFARLHGMGVTSAVPWPSCGLPDCAECNSWWYHNTERIVLAVLGEMMNVATPGITMGDVLDAAKKAGVF